MDLVHPLMRFLYEQYKSDFEFEDGEGEGVLDLQRIDTGESVIF